MKAPSALAAAFAFLAAATASASAPSVGDLNPGFSFEAFTGTAAVGRGDVDVASTLFYIDEQAADGWKSWYIFFDPGVVQDLVATLHFDQPIQAVLTTRAELDATNASYGAPGIGYGTSRFIGLESCTTDHVFCDAVSWVAGGQDLRLDSSALDPGDHIRVLVAVPEPGQALLFGAGLLGLAFSLNGRRRRG